MTLAIRNEIIGPDYPHSRSNAGNYTTLAVFWVFRLDRNIGRKTDYMAVETLAPLRQTCLGVHPTIYDLCPRGRLYPGDL